MHRRPWTFAILISSLAGLTLALLDLRLDAGTWAVFHVPFKTLTYFCETTIVDAFIRQPANTYTNLGYLLVAALMWAYTRKAVHKAGAGENSFLGRLPMFGYIYAGCLAYTFLGSAFFHASLGLFPEQVDLSAVYATAAVPLAFGLHRSLEIRDYSISRSMLLLVFGLWVLLSSIFALRMTAYYVFPGMLIATGIAIADVESRNGKPTPWKWLLTLGAAILASTFFFIADIQRIACVPDGLIHPHGMWHLSAALAAAAMFGYMYGVREER